MINNKKKGIMGGYGKRNIWRHATVPVATMKWGFVEPSTDKVVHGRPITIFFVPISKIGFCHKYFGFSTTYKWLFK